MRTTSFVSGIALLTAVLGMGMANPVGAVGSQPSLSQRSALSPSNQMLASRHCVYKRVYHPGYYTRSVPLIGKRVYHPGYYTTKRVCS